MFPRETRAFTRIGQTRVLGIGLELAWNRGSCGEIQKHRFMSFTFEKIPRLSLGCKLSPIPRIRIGSSKWVRWSNVRNMHGIITRALKSFVWNRNSEFHITIISCFHKLLLPCSSLEPLISWDLVSTKLYCFRAGVHCYYCSWIIFSANPVRRSEDLGGDP